MKSSTLTGIAAVLFGCGLVTLFAALYREAGIHSPILWMAFLLLGATIVCWFMASRAQSAES